MQTQQHRMAARMRRALVFILALTLAIITQAGCAAKVPDPVSLEGYYFDTICQITVYSMKGEMSEESAKEVIRQAFSLCEKYDDLLSATREGSDIWRINHAGGKSVSCDAQTIALIEKGIHYGDLSGGLFDITIGAAEDLWDFHGDSKKVPDAQALEEAVSRVDYHTVQVDEEAGTVMLSNPGAQIDLGGIGKGYIADRVCDLLRKEGVTGAIVSLGGNIETVGGKTQKGETLPFSIGIEKPFSEQREVVGATEALDQTVVTSGIYERYFKKNGKLYHHILLPSTGMPADTDVAGVTIVTERDRSADADALATICLLEGSEKGKKLIEGMDGYEALFILRSGEMVKTSRMTFSEVN